MARAMAELDLGRFDEAKSDIKQGIRLSPRDPWMPVFHTFLGDAEIAQIARSRYCGIPKSIRQPAINVLGLCKPGRRLRALGQDGRGEAARAETLRVNPSFTVKMVSNHTAYVIPKRTKVSAGRGLPKMTETRKLAAILVADVVGYSRLAGADEDRTLARSEGLRSELIDYLVDA